MPDTRTRADKNRAIRQEELRKQLSAQGHHQHVVELSKKIEEADTSLEVQKYKASADIQLKLMGKYLPDLKATEHTGEGGDPLTGFVIELVDAKKPTDS